MWVLITWCALRRGMLHRGRFQTYRYSAVPSTTPVVRWLLLINVGVFLLQIVFLDRYISVLGLVPASFLGKGYLWQIVTYMFLHGSFLHILFNMLFLWMMGSEIERYWGSREFLKYYFITGCGAGIVNVIVQPGLTIPTIGASGAIFGLIIAFAMAFPDREILLYFFIRMKAKHFALLVGGLEVLALLLMPRAPVARFAHLGGLLVGYIYIRRERLLYLIKRKAGSMRSQFEEARIERERERRSRMRREMDRILDKISREGIGALTEKERSFLEDQSGGGHGVS
jgi:membrane associated rhomboid family serine protease